MVVGLEPEAWKTFALGQLGASAALLGLVFVGISINLREVLTSRRLVNRAAEAVLLLASLLVGSTAVLVPEQSNRVVGVELAVLGLAMVGAVLVFQRTMAPVPLRASGESTPTPEAGDADGARMAHVIRRALGLGASVLILVAGVSLSVDAGGGLYWWAGAIVLAYAGALLGAWVLIIEILR